MLGLLRFAIQVVLFFLLLGLVIAVGSEYTGTAEKLALVPIAALLVWLAWLVRRLGDSPPGLRRMRRGASDAASHARPPRVVR